MAFDFGLVGSLLVEADLGEINTIGVNHNTKIHRETAR
jgi:hypothetical protein